LFQNNSKSIPKKPLKDNIINLIEEEFEFDKSLITAGDANAGAANRLNPIPLKPNALISLNFLDILSIP
jgi:hypothetical protein